MSVAASSTKPALWKWLALAVVMWPADVGAVRHVNGRLFEAKMELDTVAMSVDGGASIDPATYGARVAALPGASPEFRLSPDEPFREGTGPYGRFMIPASRVPGLDPFPVEVRYRNVLGEVRTRTLKVNVRRALSDARTLYLFEGQAWARVVPSSGGGFDIVFDERSDRAATVRYAIDGGPQEVLPVGVPHVHQAARPTAFTVEIRTCDGRVFTNRISGSGASLSKD